MNVEDNNTPYLTLVKQGSTPANADTGKQKLFTRTSDGAVCLVDESGTVTVLAVSEGIGTGTGLVSNLEFVIDGGGSAITPGIKGDLIVDFGCTLAAVTLLADQAGSIVVDIWKDTYANYPPTDGDSITASAPPTISGALKAQDTTLTGWTTSIGAGQTLRFNVDSAATVTRVLVALKVTRT